VPVTQKPTSSMPKSRLFKLLRRWLAGAAGMRSKHGANLALDILSANHIRDIAIGRDDGRLVHLATKDKVIASSVILSGSFGREIMTALIEQLKLKDLVPADLLFVNVGANIGTACLNAYDAGFRQFIAIEPEPENFGLLALNLDGLEDANVRFKQAAAGEEAGCLKLHRHESNMGAHSLIASEGAHHEAGAIEVAVEPLSEILERDVPFLLFVDVEGFEPQVLKGGADAISADCKAIVLEITPSKYSDEDAHDLVQRIKSFSDKFVLLPEGENHPTTALSKIMDDRRGTHFDIVILRGEN